MEGLPACHGEIPPRAGRSFRWLRGIVLLSWIRRCRRGREPAMVHDTPDHEGSRDVVRSVGRPLFASCIRGDHWISDANRRRGNMGAWRPGFEISRVIESPTYDSLVPQPDHAGVK